MTREYYLTHRERILAKKHEQYWSDPESKKRAAKKWRDANIESARQRETAYRISNPEKVSAAKKRCYQANKDNYLATNAKWRIANPERVLASVEAWRKANPEKVKQMVKRWKNANRDKVLEDAREYARKWRVENLELARARHKAWAKANPDKIRIQLRKRYGRRKATTKSASYTFSDVKRLYSEQKGLCANPFCACDLNETFHIDHSLPLSRGGSNGPDNIQLMCPSCNSRKHAKTMDEFIVWQKKRILKENGKI